MNFKPISEVKCGDVLKTRKDRLDYGQRAGNTAARKVSWYDFSSSFGSYRSDHPEFGVSTEEYFNQVCLALDKYSTYDKFLLAGDFNTEETNEVLSDFVFEHNVKNLVQEPTCFKSQDNPSCIDLFLTNTPQSFRNRYYNYRSI